MKQHKYIYIMLIAVLMAMNSVPRGNALTIGTRLQDGVSDEHIMEDITFESRYKTSKDFSVWKITNNKALEIQLSVTANPSNKIILVTHMYAVFYIESTSDYYDDIEQDYMDDFIEGSDQGGFFVNGSYPYKETFSVKGMSQDFIDMLGAGALNDPSENFGGFADYNYFERLTEDQLISFCDVVGQTLYVVFDILVKLPHEEYFHKFAISDNIFIDLNGTVILNHADAVEKKTENRTTAEIDGYNIWFLLPSVSVGCLIITKMLKRKQ